jgi:hypothetical protein
MYQIPLNKEIFIAAYRKAVKLGAIKNSIMKGGGNFTGYVGEYAVKSFFGQPLEFETFDYDMILNGKKYDVKSKRTTVIPQMFHDGSVCEKNVTQKCDYYLFVRVYWPKEIQLPLSCFMMSYYPSKQYISEAKVWKKGQLDSKNNYIVKEDCRNILYDKMLPISELIQENFK